MIRYYVLENQNPRSFVDGYIPGDRLRLAAVGRISGDGDPNGDQRHILDGLFARYNRDDRPNGKVAPSMSVGDVVTLCFDNGDGISSPLRSFVCQPIGWVQETTTHELLPSASQLEDFAVRLLEA